MPCVSHSKAVATSTLLLTLCKALSVYFYFHFFTLPLGRLEGTEIITSISQIEKLRSKEVTFPRSQRFHCWNSTQSLAFLSDLKKELDKKVQRREGGSLSEQDRQWLCIEQQPTWRKGRKRLRGCPGSVFVLQEFDLSIPEPHAVPLVPLLLK